jgi:hypothetical protein
MLLPNTNRPPAGALRWVLWVVGPLAIVTASLWLSKWAHSEPAGPPAANHVIVRGQDPGSSNTPAAGEAGGAAARALLADCRKEAAALAGKLGPECQVIVRRPWVLAGDMSQDDLDGWYTKTVGPAQRAMAHAYFRTPPDRPIALLLFSGERSYNHYARQLFGEEGISVYGYYKPQERTLIMNIGTGAGTLVHEMTHALISFDFPQVPDWFNEGLASLHEASQIRRDESGIDGLTNWRLPGLQKAVRDGRLASLFDLLGETNFRGEHVGLNYAYARYACLFMQRRGALVDFYDHFRAAHERDSEGAATLLALFPGASWEQLDREFRAWVLSLEWKRG